MVTMAETEAFGQRIGQEFRPTRVLLFGSYATGTPTPDSDVDILVVMPHKGKGHRMATKIRGRIRPRFPLDLIVRTSEQVRQRLDLGDCFVKEITQKGKVLYESTDE